MKRITRDEFLQKFFEELLVGSLEKKIGNKPQESSEDFLWNPGKISKEPFQELLDDCLEEFLENYQAEYPGLLKISWKNL